MELYEEEVKQKEEKRRLRIPKFSGKVYLFVGLGAVFFILSLFMFSGEKQIIQTSADVELVNRLLEENLKLQKQMLEELKQEIKSLKEEIRTQKPVQVNERKSPAGTSFIDLLKTRKKEKEKENRIKELERKLKELEKQKTRVRKREKLRRKLELEYRERKVQRKEKQLQNLAKKKDKKKTVYIPSGTVLKGKIVSGFFAPVGGKGVKKFPVVLIELEGVASAPNDFFIPLDKCRVVAKAEGDWVTERAILQTYKISCVLPSGKVIEKRFNANVVSGIDGMDGVKGKFVNASAKQLRTFFAGTFLGTLFEALAQAETRTTIAVEGGTVLRSEVIENEASYAFYRALADTWKEFSRFYLEQARKALPVVLVEGGIPVYLQVIDGFSLEVTPDEMVAVR